LQIRSLDKPSKLEQLNLDIKTPPGYVCSNEQDLMVSSHAIVSTVWEAATCR
jgi:hypothetical protein